METTREIKVFSTLTRKKIETNASNWGELQTELRRENIRFDNMKVAIGKSKVMLEHPQAELPTNAFTLYLMPTKTKSGNDWNEESIRNLSYDEMRDLVRDLFLEDSETADEHFNAGDHYTYKKKDSLEKCLIEWFSVKTQIAQLAEQAPSNLNGNNSQDFTITEVNKSKDSFMGKIIELRDRGFVESMLEQLESFETENEELTNSISYAVMLLRSSIEDWSKEEAEYQDFLKNIYDEEEDNNEYYEEDEDDELGY